MKEGDIRFTKLLVLVCGAVPLALLIWDQARNRLGANPQNFIILTTGMMTLTFLMLTMAVTPGEVPKDLSCAEKCERNFEFVHSLIKRAQKNGELDKSFKSRELAFGFYGLANFHLVSHLVARGCEPDRLTAKKVVELFLAGADAKKRSRARKQTAGHKEKK